PKPPYPPATQPVGLLPSPTPDIPVCAVLLSLFFLAGATHLLLFRRHLARAGQRFIFSLLLMGFCITRIAALSLRIVWARNQTNANIALAATVFTAAGVLLLFIVNLILTVRVVRGMHPALGWSRGVWWGFRGVIASVVACLIMVVVCSVHTLFTLDVATRLRERQVLLFAGVYMSVLAFVPVVVLGVASVVANRGPHPSETFGKGRMGTKVALVMGMSALLTLGAGFRCGTNFAAKPIGQVEWFHSRAAFYCFNFAIELVVVYTYAIFRFEQRFHVPAGSSAPGHYTAGGPPTEEDSEKRGDGMNSLEAGSGGSAITDGGVKNVGQSSV
ncbi:hypothetical protein C8A05DRAFT_14459, partial [Staphylotrichum tortipilum]